MIYTRQKYPRTMFHPEYGLAPRPDISKFTSDCRTADQYRTAFKSFTEAEEQWARGNRILQANNKEDEERLAKKGWLLTPLAKLWFTSAFDMESEEL
jgi:hypothetical protein